MEGSGRGGGGHRHREQGKEHLLHLRICQAQGLLLAEIGEGEEEKGGRWESERVNEGWKVRTGEIGTYMWAWRGGTRGF